MKSLYLISYNGLIGLVVFVLLSCFFQSILTAYSISCIRLKKSFISKSLEESLILCQLLLIVVQLAQVLFNSDEGFMVERPYMIVHGILLAAILIIGGGIIFKSRKLYDFLPLPLSMLVSPFTEAVLKKAEPLFLLFAVALYMLRAIIRIHIFNGILKANLSAVSIKQAVDSLNFGILFCRADKFSYGQILLANKKARDLMLTMTGNVFYDGSEFYKRISVGDTLSSCKANRLGERPVYTLPDGSVWRFDMKAWKAKNKKYFLLMASDSTRLKEISDELAVQNEALREKNDELKELFQNLESICRKEETFRVKNQVHDILGQRISMILRSVRENREPDEALLSSFANGLPVDLKNAAADYNASLKRMAESFRKLGIDVRIDGKLPPNLELQKTFFEIMTEAMTNAVRHGYATEIDISVCLTCGEWVLLIKNNGITGEGPVSEGGGLTFIREKVSSLGGTFTYVLKPQFSIIVKVPEGGSL